MGLVARVLAFYRTQRNGAQVSKVKGDPGGGANTTPDHYAPPGDDSQPLPGDYFAAIRGEGAGRKYAVGYIDPSSTPQALAGEKRIYARDADTGAVVAEIWLKNTGDIICSNGAGSFELQAGGDIVLNGVTISPGGVISAASAIVNGKELADHTHPAGTPPGNTGPNN